MFTDRAVHSGRYFFAAAMAAFGIQHFIYGYLGAGLGPPWTPVGRFWACVTGVVLVVSAIFVLLSKQMQIASSVLALLLLGRVLVVYTPMLVDNIRHGGAWTSGCEILAMCGGALILAGKPPWTGEVGRYFVAFALVVFGILHFVYADYVASVIPGWIAGHYFWTYFVGVAFFAAALSLLTRTMARLAATSLGIMFLLWVVVLHAPRVIADSGNGNEWTSALVALAMCGLSLGLARVQDRPDNVLQ